ncbi:MAG: hypothetical protein ABSD56_07915 [Bryobacteraceae bacterium]
MAELLQALANGIYRSVARATMRTDTFRGSQERRSVILLAGKPAVMPSVPVRREDAVRWFAWWPAHFFSMAVRERNRRNLRKIAAEM